jgi:chromatin segregation and condensation protein Rec8/ScpA/Scc1 (kleisin family)
MLLERLRASSHVLFESLFSDAKSRMEVVVTFLAMLELVKVRAIRVLQDELNGPIIIEAAVGLEEAGGITALQENEEERHGT